MSAVVVVALPLFSVGIPESVSQFSFVRSVRLHADRYRCPGCTHGPAKAGHYVQKVRSQPVCAYASFVRTSSACPTALQSALRLRYAFDGRPRPFARFSFAWLNERELPEAVKRMAAARP